MFTIDPKLNSGSFTVAELKFSRLLLKNDSNYLWFILVPRKVDAVELTDLDFADQTEILHEINQVSKALQKGFAIDKLNIATLGNMVKQLHIHVIGRFKTDIAFPKPIWEFAAAKPYEEKAAQDLIKKIQSLLEV
jgi:diadenosine tetraphosphate (Ap4A) HIT family hydrolase